ncbi:DNase I-like protein [Eremomyces bilateralis CBS 781.70]|uniref:DNase I-like protein n=1 Tax=Eremomyces bilateralis CBS 781.70 TaxID=1392243 RepID=A0A6G1GDP9_9PEZI|nr:DNase I-like protein [Eremomyces bilateralis CBS 781.70]KAF1816217.1 DNase I-like protein [Eremomyces bilateralis CBS 781.70]
MAPHELHVVSLNVWGIKWISTHHTERIREIGRQLARSDPAPNIVGLQECFSSADLQAVQEETRDILPYSKYYHSGVFGGGLAILSKWPIEESSMTGYALNGLPWAFYRGDWYVGKGFSQTRIRIPADEDGDEEVVEVFNTHLHAPYHPPPKDVYWTHRLSQAWQLAKQLRSAVSDSSVSLVLGLGDFNSRPLSMPHKIIERHGRMKDAWLQLHPQSAAEEPEGSSIIVDIDPPRERTSSIEPAADLELRRPGHHIPTVRAAIEDLGMTCDSGYNTWRWSKPVRKQLKKNAVIIPDETPDPRAKRLDYVFYADGAKSSVAKHSPGVQGWTVGSAKVGMTATHPTLNCSLSDHFSVEVTLVRAANNEAQSSRQSHSADGSDTSSHSLPDKSTSPPQGDTPKYLSVSDYSSILSHITRWRSRQQQQRRLRLGHLVAQFFIAIGCLVSVWFSPRNFVSFILMLVSTLGLAAGVLDGIQGGLFVSSELNALTEFEWDVSAVLDRAGAPPAFK